MSVLGRAQLKRQVFLLHLRRRCHVCACACIPYGQMPVAPPAPWSLSSPCLQAAGGIHAQRLRRRALFQLPLSTATPPAPWCLSTLCLHLAEGEWVHSAGGQGGMEGSELQSSPPSEWWVVWCCQSLSSTAKGDLDPSGPPP